MPPPRIRKQHLISKQKKLIATRLMQISLLVEDYVYQHKPMSENSANAYINEIAGYKDKCYQDARSLQVIEKLTRCMQGIIYEQQELHGACSTEEIYVPYQDGKNDYMQSPVYSIVDEDLTQFIDIEDQRMLNTDNSTADLNRAGNFSGNDVDVENPLCMKANITNPYKTLNEEIQNRDAVRISLIDEPVNEVIDLGDDIVELIENNTSFRHEPEFNIQNAISNLSIKDVNEAFTPFSQECSQSILDSYKFDSNSQMNDKTDAENQPPKVNYGNPTTITAVPQRPATEKISFKHGPTKVVLPLSKKVNAQLNPIHKIVIQSNEIFKEAKKTKMAKRKNRKAADNASEKIVTKKPRANAKKNKLQQNKDLSIKANKSTQELHSNKNVQTMHSHQCDTKQLPYQDIQATMLTNKITPMNHNTFKNTTEPVPKIYKTQIVEDLSWVENLKFVREVQYEEYETFTKDEGFWENCTLPDNFNEDDFNY